MRLNVKKTSIVLVILISVIVVCTVILNVFISNKLKATLAELPNHIIVNYDAISSNIWLRKFSVKHPVIVVKGQTTDKTLLKTEAEAFNLEGFSIWKYLLEEKIDIKTIDLSNSVSEMFYNFNLQEDSYQKEATTGLKNDFVIHNVIFNEANILTKNIENDSIIFSISKLNSTVKELKFNKGVFVYDSFTVGGNNLFLAVNKFENLNISEFNISNKTMAFINVDLFTKYSKSQLSSILEQERDHVKVNFKEIRLQALDLNFNNGFSLSSKSSEINLPNIEIFRNKLLPDDFKTKPLYSKLLRDLNFKLNIDELKINDGQISYFEKVNNDNKKPGTIRFNNLNAEINNLGNVNTQTPVNITVDALFMEDSNCHIDWNFEVADTTDAFVFKADLKNLNASKINQFIEPNLKVKLKGELQQTYFSVYGNNNISNTDLKIKYDDFEVSVLKENGKEKRKLLSTLVNWFVLNNTNYNDDNFRYGKAENIMRHKNKSVFNYVWINVKQGLLSAMTGSEKRD
ncbi:DUF748 domain-containing protein [Neotamlana sedimentorum]|nr:DUF748 domain-containing protein [Tamlana sedimentorum]